MKEGVINSQFPVFIKKNTIYNCIEEQMTTMKNKCNKWTLVFLFYSLFTFNAIWKTVNGAPEKLTQEQVLEELGVKIETKGKTFFLFFFK